MENVKCKYDELLPLNRIIPNPKNPNKHSEDSINKLADNIDYQGIRWPIIISKRSGYIAAGHGRLYAAKKLGYESFPVMFQDFESEAQEYEFLVADNKLSELSHTDKDMVLDAIKEIPDLNLDMLAIGSIENDLAPMESLGGNLTENNELYKEKELDENLETKNNCPSCGYKW